MARPGDNSGRIFLIRVRAVFRRDPERFSITWSTCAMNTNKEVLPVHRQMRSAPADLPDAHIDPSDPPGRKDSFAIPLSDRQRHEGDRSLILRKPFAGGPRS